MSPAAHSESSVHESPLRPVPAVTQPRAGPVTRLHFNPDVHPQFGTRPQGVSRQLEQWNVESQIRPDPHVPQLPPQPSSPHVRPVQSGVHTQRPVLVSQNEGEVQVPQLPPQPSLPQARPVQSGVQVRTQCPLTSQVSPDPHVPQEVEQMGSGPHTRPRQEGTQTHKPDELHTSPASGSQSPHER